MARAATKKGKRVREAPRPPRKGGNVSGSAKAVEQQLFFGRLRTSAKWVFALLAVVFATTFVFLGVGSGTGSGLLDITHWFGGGSSGPSVQSLQKKVAENPQDAATYLRLGQVLQQKGRTRDAIDAYKHYVALRPRSIGGLQELSLLYQKRARNLSAQLQKLSTQPSPLPDASQFQPGGKLGQALAVFSDPFQQTLTAQATQQQGPLQTQLQGALHDALGAVQRAAALQPNDPTAQFGVAQTAQSFGDLTTALAAYQRFVRRFPDDAFAAQAKQQVKAIKKQLAASSTVGSSPQR